MRTAQFSRIGGNVSRLPPFERSREGRFLWRYAPTGACPRGARDSWAKRKNYVPHFDPHVLVTWVKEIRRQCAVSRRVASLLQRFVI
jgi:hypothetical protein